VEKAEIDISWPAKENARDAEIARTAFEGRKRSALAFSVETSEFDVQRPAKKVKKDLTKASGIKRKSEAGHSE
jgi:hypothetical protein